jgi:hypothetical protein
MEAPLAAHLMLEMLYRSRNEDLVAGNAGFFQRSSWSPGCSLTSMSGARGGPCPGTTCVANS